MTNGLRPLLVLVLALGAFVSLAHPALAQDPTATTAMEDATETPEAMDDATATAEDMADATATDAMEATATEAEAMEATATPAQPAQLPATGVAEALPISPALIGLLGLAFVGLGLVFRSRKS